MNDIKAFFDTLAPHWDTLCVHDEKKIRVLLERIGMKPGSRVLDVGCGTGILEKFLLDYHPRQIVGVDLSEEMIKEAKKKYTQDTVTFIATDVLNLDHEPYDTIIIYSAFPHFPDPKALIEKMTQLLKTSGKLAICHSQSRAKINGHHHEKASQVSWGLPEATKVATYLEQDFHLQVIIDNEDYYMVVGEKKGGQ